MKRHTNLPLLATLACLPAAASGQAPSSEAVNEANNPLTPKITINLHDQWAPKLYDSDDYTNQFLLRGLIPHRLGGAPQLLRFTMPALVTVPDGTGGTTTGTGLWQGGLAGVAIAPQSWGILGGLLTWQHSFAGPSDRATQNNLTLQPRFRSGPGSAKSGSWVAE
jgi:hypothetical protein